MYSPSIFSLKYCFGGLLGGTLVQPLSGLLVEVPANKSELPVKKLINLIKDLCRERKEKYDNFQSNL